MSLGSHGEGFAIGSCLGGDALCFSFALLLLGCTKDSDTLVVETRKIIPTRKVTQEQPHSPSLKVAVAAMISPKELFVYYQQRIEYVGKKMQRSSDIVHRKLYGEINQILGIGQIDLAFICSRPYAGRNH